MIVIDNPKEQELSGIHREPGIRYSSPQGSMWKSHPLSGGGNGW